MKKLAQSGCILLIAVSFLFAAMIREGNVLDIQVLTHEEFSGKFMVSNNGTIEYPLLAEVNITSFLTSELMNELTFRLAKHIDNPMVLISIVEKPEMTVTVLGQITNPGPVKAYLGATIQEVIQLAGGPLEQADITQIKIVHKNGEDENADFFNLKEFMKKGSYNLLPKLLPDDVIILLAEEKNTKIKVIGAVNQPGFFTLEEEMNVFELIYLAGGPSENADLSKVRRFFKLNDKTLEEVIDIQEYLDKGKMDKIPFVNEGDVIIVYSKWFDWKILLTILNNLLLFIVTVQSIRGAFN